MRPEQDDTQASELQCFHDLYNIYIGTKKVTNSGHVGTSDYLNTKAGTCSVNRVQQTQDIFYLVSKRTSFRSYSHERSET